MRLYITLGLIAVSFSAVFALRCHQCKYKYNSSEECRQNLTKCPLQCGSITIYNNGSTLDRSEKNCTDPAVCVTDAIHFGQNKMTFNPQCCDTDLCNTEEAPALLRYFNGMMCYTCDMFNKDCSKIVTCSGDQNKCFSSKVNIIDMKTKGCASDTLCENNLLNTLGSISGTYKCCEGILCNSGQSLKKSLFPLLVPLLSLLFL
ncbi:ly6/PLAUR domain-containing protein 8-like [Megalobrama amblycephala]|uniref:ly6/PLAUR domain-containing protein 8-like n=1 Tax=Megalobrama amblycephala TaxID=75352 RepID=UPI002014471E|nr:ly6/PLAUR domain-containing protein 8-like [Megalobrama amblycephala]